MDEMWERANNWAVHKLVQAGYTDGDSHDAQVAQAALLTAALACPTLIDIDDEPDWIELTDPDS